MKTVVLTIVVLGVLGVGAGLLFMYSGIYDVGADQQDNPVVAWVLGTTSDASLKLHATGQPTIDLSSRKSILTGAAHYRAMCAMCHGYPGWKPSDISQGLNPPPPDLKEAGSEWPDNRVCWVVKHGIRMTGMPAFGKTHSDDEVWMMVAFVKQYPGLTQEKYMALMRQAPQVE